MNTNLGQPKNSKKSQSVPAKYSFKIPFIPLYNSKITKSPLAMGMLTCLALGTFTLGSGFRSINDSKESSAYYESNQDQDNTQNESAEIENLKGQLQSIGRKLQEYQAQLFRASHPKDQTKIAELGQLLSEKEKLNSQLTTSIKNLEKELAATRKQVATLEVTSDALNTLLYSHRAVSDAEGIKLREQLEQIKNAHASEKQALLDKIETTEAEHLRLSKQLNKKNASLKDLKNTISSQNSTTTKLLKELQDLSELYALSQQRYQHEVDAKSLALFEELQALDVVAKASQENLTNQTRQLSQLIDKERHLAERLNDELQSAQLTIVTHEKRIQELEQHHSSSLAFASDLTSQLSAAHHEHNSTQQHLSSVLEDLEGTKASLLDELKVSKKELEDKLTEIQTLKSNLNEIIAQHEVQQKYSQSLTEQLRESVQEASSLKMALGEHQAASNLEQEALNTFKLALSEEVLVSSQLDEQLLQMSAQLNATKDLYQNLEKKLEAVTLENSEKAKALENSEHNILTLNTTIDGILNEKLELQQKIDHLSSQLATHEEHKDLFSKTLQDIEDALATTHTFYQSAIDDFSSQLEELQTKFVKEEERSSFLKSELDAALTLQLQHDQNINTNLQPRIDELSQQLVEAKLKLVFNENQIKQLHEASDLLKAKHESEVQTIQSELAKHLADSTHLQNHLETLSLEHASDSDIRTHLEEKLHELATLLQENESLLEEKERQLTITNESTNTHQQQLFSLKQQLESLESESNILQHSLATRDQEFKEHQESLSKEIERLHQEITDRRSASEHLQQHIDALTLKHADESNVRAHLEAKLHEFATLLQEKERILEEKERQLTLNNESTNSHQEQLLSLKQQQETLENESNSLKQSLTAQEQIAKEHQEALSKEIERLHLEITDRRSASEQLQQHINALSERHADESDVRTLLEDKLHELATLLQEKEYNINELNKIRDDESDNRSHLQERVKELTSLLEENENSLSIAIEALNPYKDHLAFLEKKLEESEINQHDLSGKIEALYQKLQDNEKALFDSHTELAKAQEQNRQISLTNDRHSTENRQLPVNPPPHQRRKIRRDRKITRPPVMANILLKQDTADGDNAGPSPIDSNDSSLQNRIAILENSLENIHNEKNALQQSITSRENELLNKIEELTERAEKSEKVLKDWYTVAAKTKKINQKLQQENEKLSAQIQQHHTNNDNISSIKTSSPKTHSEINLITKKINKTASTNNKLKGILKTD